MTPHAPLPDRPAHSDRADICHEYAVPPGAHDELWAADGTIRSGWVPYIEHLRQRGCGHFERSHQEVTRMLRENGVAYHIHGAPQGVHRQWRLDIVPLMIGTRDWQTIESGLRQRVLLLDLVLRDLYGPRRLVREGLLPVELVAAHGGFLRPCRLAHPPQRRMLLLYSADLARGPDGRVRVLSDRTQQPSGLGYALENRTAMANVMPELFRACRVERLSSFFRSLRDVLAELPGRKNGPPATVVFSPGPRGEAYFEHAYLGSYLGYPVVQGDDLTVRDDRVWLKTLDGLKPVDTLLRMLPDRDCDPLELDPDSSLGLAGLLEAARRGRVAMANPLGTGVLENPGLMAFLPGIARHLLGEDLLLESVPTWWCGRPDHLAHVLQELPRLIVKPVDRGGSARYLVGSQLSSARLEEWRGRIRSRPHLYAAQEQLRFSSAPSLVENRLEPFPTLFRAFVLAGDDGGPTVMPGGIARSSPAKDSDLIFERTGGILKDTWVVTARPRTHTSLWLQPREGGEAFAQRGALTSRAAENLFWVGRYAERAEVLARMLRTVLRHFGEMDRVDEETAGQCLERLVEVIDRMTIRRLPAPGEAGARQQPGAAIAAILGDGEDLNSLYRTLQSFLNAAHGVRDRWSTDTWRIINDIEAHRRAIHRTEEFDPRRIQADLDRLVTSLLAFSGLCMESITREDGWILLDIGRRIERSLMFGEFLRRCLVPAYAAPLDNLMMESALITTENIITYRRRYRSYMALDTVLERSSRDPQKITPKRLLFCDNDYFGRCPPAGRRRASAHQPQRGRFAPGGAAGRIRLPKHNGGYPWTGRTFSISPKGSG